MRKLAFVLIGVGGLALGGCDHDIGDYSVGGCPRLINYTAEQQREAAAEIRRNPNGQLARFASDYGKMRKACRV